MSAASLRTIDLEALVLQRGTHASITEGACLLEVVSYVAREPWSDHPKCVSPVIATFGRSWNDSLNDADRNRLLKPMIPKLIGTNTGAADEEVRAWMATDWLVRVQAPAWLDLAGLRANAAELRALPALTSPEIARGVQSVIEKARGEASSARDAARDAARAAARDAARDAAWAAAGDAARDAAGAAAWAAAWAAAGAAAWAAAWAAARDAARDAAWAAAGDAARDAAGAAAWAAAWAAAGDAARDAARDAADRRLAPTVTVLQESAVALIESMCAVGRSREAEP